MTPIQVALFVASIAFVVGIVVASLLWRREVNRGALVMPSVEAGQLPFVKTDAVLSPLEKDLYGMLIWALEKDGFVLPKVSLAEITTLPRDAPRREVHLRAIKSRVVDFLVCDKEFAPTMVVEVGEKPKAGRMSEDQAFLDSALRPAGIPVLWLPTRKSYQPHELRQIIRDATRQGVEGDGAGAPGATQPGEVGAIELSPSPTPKG